MKKHCNWECKCEIGLSSPSQLLRLWFISEMARPKAPDGYVDAFCGRVPMSIPAMHYTDYSPETLKEIYDKASLKVLE